MDTRDLGGGRWRLCLIAPEPLTLEGSAWCHYDEARATIREVAGIPTNAGPIAYDAFLSFDPAAFELHLTLTRPPGVIASYEPGGARPIITAEAGGRSGSAAFDVFLVVDPEEAERPPGAHPGHRGTFSWRCGVAPPPG